MFAACTVKGKIEHTFLDSVNDYLRGALCTYMRHIHREGDDYGPKHWAMTRCPLNFIWARKSSSLIGEDHDSFILSDTAVRITYRILSTYKGMYAVVAT